MSADPGRLAPVELTDDDGAPAVRPRAGESRGTPRAAAARWWSAGLLLVLAAALVGGARLSADADRRDQDDVARLSAEPGFTGSLREPLVELWRTPDRLVGAGAGVVLVEDRTAMPALLRARDARTGAERWEAGWTSRLGVTRCVEGAGALLCEIPGAGFGAPNTDELLGEVPGRLLLVDPDDGRLLARSDLDGRTVGWATVDADVVTGRRVGDRLVVVRSAVASADGSSTGGSRAGGGRGSDPVSDPVSTAWRAVWTVEVPLPEGATANQLTLRVDRGAVVVEGRVGVVLDAGDGSVVVPPQHPDDAGVPVRVLVATTGAAVWGAADAGARFDRSTGTVTPLRGGPVEQSPDDGSAPEVLLLDRGDRLVAVDAASGSGLWERPAQPWRRLARVSGSVLLLEPGALVRVDARTGAQMWRRPLPVGADGGAPPPGAFLLDARRVLLGGALTHGRPAAVDLADGVQVWSDGTPGRAVLRPGTGAATVLAEAGGEVSAWGHSPP